MPLVVREGRACCGLHCARTDRLMTIGPVSMRAGDLARVDDRRHADAGSMWTRRRRSSADGRHERVGAGRSKVCAVTRIGSKKARADVKSFSVRLRSARAVPRQVRSNPVRVHGDAAVHGDVAMSRHESASFKCFSFRRCQCLLACGARAGDAVARLRGDRRARRGRRGKAPV